MGAGSHVIQSIRASRLFACAVLVSVLTACGGGFSVLISPAADESHQLSINPSDISFGNVPINGQSVQTVTLRNIGTAAVTVSQASINGTVFSVSGISLPVNLPAGQSTNFFVKFSPQTAGRVAGSMSVVSNASNSPMAIALTGSGVKAHSVDLAWSASTSLVSGYNVYRSSQTGGPYAKLNSSLVEGTSYSDNTAQASQTYFYVATAVDPDGVESSYSNEAESLVTSP